MTWQDLFGGSGQLLPHLGTLVFSGVYGYPRRQNKPKNPSVSITTKSPTHIDAPTVGDTQTPSNLGEFDCITLLGLVNVRAGLHASTWVYYSEKMTGGQGVLIDCASVITLSASSVITLHINRLCTVK